MCTIDPMFCWYYNRLDYWKAHPEELKIASEEHKKIQDETIKRHSMRRHEVKIGLKRNHEIESIEGNDGPYLRYTCYEPGYGVASCSVGKNRICFNCKTSIDT